MLIGHWKVGLDADCFLTRKFIKPTVHHFDVFKMNLASQGGDPSSGVFFVNFNQDSRWVFVDPVTREADMASLAAN